MVTTRPALVGVGEPEGHPRHEHEDRSGPPAAGGDHGQEEAPVQPLLADARGHPDHGEQPPLLRRPGQQRSAACTDGCACRPS